MTKTTADEADARSNFPGAEKPHVRPHLPTRRELADFTADHRTLNLAGLAICVGTLGTGTAWLLMKMITIVTSIVWFGSLTHAGLSLADVHRSLWMVFAPAFGGLVVGLMARYGSPTIRGHGIPEAIATILKGNSRISPKVAILKPISSAVSIGTGGPYGAEGPIIMTGGAIGSLFAQFFHLSAAERKTLLVSGAAAGMTAIFGTPIAAVLLAVELLLFEWKPRSFIPVSVAAIVAILLRPLLFGATPLFPAAGIEGLHWWRFFAAGFVGLLVGILSGTLSLGLYKAEDMFERLPIHWMWWPAIGGLVVGLGGLIEPRALGVGYDVIADLINNRLALGAVLLILVVKSTIWLISLSSGTSGGVLAPLLIIGGALGWLVGIVLPGNPGFWALVGMSSMLAGSMRAPLTGAIFAVELTGISQGFAVLLCGTVSAYAVTVLLLKRSILTEKIARRGQHITYEYATDPFEATRAHEVMTKDVETLSGSMSISGVIAFFQKAESIHLGYPIVDEKKRLVGYVSRREVLAWQLEDGMEYETLSERLSDAETPVAHPDDVVGHVVDLMTAQDSGMIAIVDPKTRELRGIITRRDVLDVRRATHVEEHERARFYTRRWTGTERSP